MPLGNIKRRESVPCQGIAKLKRRKKKTVYSIQLYCSIVGMPLKDQNSATQLAQ